MDGWRISYFLSMDMHTAKHFKGFAMSDFQELPFNAFCRALYILNTDRSDGPGKHWCALFFDNGKAEFFDPLGMYPGVYNFLHFLRGYDVMYNTQQVQGMFSNVCGHHCLFFAYHRCRGLSMKEILKLYDKGNVEKNDAMVAAFILKFGKIFDMR